MKGKSKQLVALLLSVLLIVAGLPTSALAAHSATASQGDPTITIDVTVSKDFKGNYGNSEYTENKGRPASYDPIPIQSTKDYMNNIDKGGKMFQDAFNWSPQAVNETKLAENIQNVDALYVGKASESVKPGEVVYVGVKFDFEDTRNTYKGAVQETAYIVYRSDVFEPDITNYPIAYHAAITNDVLGPDDEGDPENWDYVSRYSGGKVNELWKDKTPGTPYVISKIKTVDPETGVISGEKTPEHPLASIGVMIDNSGTSDNNLFCTNEGTWDVVIPLKVKADAALGTYEIGFERFVASKANLASGMALTKLDANNGATKTAINGAANTGSYLFAAGGENGYDHITYTKATVKVHNPSKGENEAADYTDKITDKKNLPYIAAADVGVGAFDTVTFPSNTDFIEGDTIVFYTDKDEDGYGVNEVGRTLLTRNQVTPDGGGDSYNIFTGTVNSKAPMSDQTAYLADYRDEKWAPAGTSYLKNEGTYYIARLQPPTGGKEMTPSTVVGPFTVSAEKKLDTPLYYTESISAVKDPDTTPGGKAANPVVVPFGSTIDDVLAAVGVDNLISPSEPVNVAIESCLENVTTAATLRTSWANLARAKVQYQKNGATAGVYTENVVNQNGTSTDGKTFLTHGDFVLINPYADTANYQQPREYYDGDKPLYGAELYVRVVPATSDYYVLNYNGGEKKAVQISGKTAANLSVGDEISLYTDKADDDASEPAAAAFATLEVDTAGSTGIKKLYTSTSENALENIPAADKGVWVRFKEAGAEEASEAVRMVVSSSAAQVSDNVNINTLLDDETITIYQGETVSDLFDRIGSVTAPVNALDVDKGLVGVETKIAFKLDTDVLASDATTVTGVTDVIDTGTGLPMPIADAKTELQSINRQRGATFTVTYPIPAYAQNLYKGTSSLEYPTDDGKDYTNYHTAEYSNTQNKTATLVLKVRRHIPMKSVTVEVIENDAQGVGKYDTLKIRETGGTTALKGAYDTAGAAEIRVQILDEHGKFVSAAEDTLQYVGTPDPPEDPYFTARVPQTARDAGTSLQLQIGYVSYDPMEGAYAFTMGKQETVTITEVIDGTSPITYNSTDLARDGKTVDEMLLADTAAKKIELPTFKYGYYKKQVVPEGSSDPEYVLDETTVKTGTFDLTGVTWSTPDTANEESYEAGFTSTTSDFVMPETVNVAEEGQAAVNAGVAVAADVKLGTNTTYTAGDGFKFSRFVQEVKGAYDDPADEATGFTPATPIPTDIMKHVTIENKPYPEQDVIKVKSDANAKGVHVEVFDGYENGAVTGTRLAYADIGDEDAVLTWVADGAQTLKADPEAADKLYFTFTKAGYSASTGSYSKGYDSEPYVLWETTSVTPETAHVRIQDVKNNSEILDTLPKTMTATVARLTYNEADSKYEPNNSDTAKISVSVDATQWQYRKHTEPPEEEETYGALSTLSSALIPTGVYDFQGGYDATAVLATNPKIAHTETTGEETTVTMIPVVAIPASVTAPEDYNKAVVKVTLDDAGEGKTPLPSPIEIKLNGDANPAAVLDTDEESFTYGMYVDTKKNDADSTNDSISVSIKSAVDDLEEGEKTKWDGAVVLLTYMPEGAEEAVTLTSTGTMASPNYTVKFEYGAGADDFKGLPLAGGSFELYFKNPNVTHGSEESEWDPSDPVTVKFAEAQTKSKITENSVLHKLNFVEGFITGADDLYRLVPDTTAVLNLDPVPDEAVEVALRPQGGTGSGTKIAWSLETSTDGETWTEPSDAWEVTLAKVTAGKQYRLSVPFALTDAQKEKVENPDDKYLAIVPITLYTKDNDPVVLHDGNNDLWVNKNDSTSLAATYMRAHSSLKAADFQTDVLFYYFLENYEEHVKPYVEGNKGVIGLKVNNTTITAAQFEANEITVKDAKELTVAGKPVFTPKYKANGDADGTTPHIEPKHSTSFVKYYNTTEKTVTRHTETYWIEYTVEDKDGNEYFAKRKVTLRYQPGDADSSGDIGTFDLIPARSGILGTDLFTGISDEEQTELKRQILDFDGSGDVGTFDLIPCRSYQLNPSTLPALRW